MSFSDQPQKYLEKVYDDLRFLAAKRLSAERKDHTLQPTALVHEVFLSLKSYEKFRDTSHYFATAAKTMQHILVDWSRKKLAKKRHREDQVQIQLESVDHVYQDPAEIIAISDLINAFELKHPRRAELVRMRVFSGCTIDECAKLLGISTSTAGEDWVYSRAWLKRELLKIT